MIFKILLDLIMFNLFPFYIPVKTIKEIDNKKLKEEILVKIIVLMVLSFFSLKFFLFFAFIYIMILLNISLYYLFKDKLKALDEIFISSIIISSISFIYLEFFLKFLRKNIEFYKIFETNKNLILKEYGEHSTVIWQSMKDHRFSIIFISVFLFVYITKKVLDYKNYKKWELSYFYTIIFVAATVYEVFYTKNLISENILMCIKIPYIFLAIKNIYSFLEKYLKLKFIIILFAYMLGLHYPLYMFIVGALQSFFTKKNKNLEV